MAVNRGKKFEDVFRKSCEQVPDISIDRLHDQTTRFKGSQNICDFIVYRKPYEYYFECKSVHGNTLSIHSNPKPDKDGVLHGFHGNITDKQWTGLLEKSQVKGVFAGVVCWFIDHDVTVFLPIKMLQDLYELGHKSVGVKGDWQQFYGKDWNWHWLGGEKKRVYFDYNVGKLLDDINFMHENY